MADYLHTGLQLVSRHLPDYSMETDADGNKHRVELPGQLQIGAEVEGVFVPLITRKASGVFEDIARHKRAQAAEPPVEG